MKNNQKIALDTLAEVIARDCREYRAEKTGTCSLTMNGIDCKIDYELRFLGSTDKSQGTTKKYVRKQLENYIQKLNYETGTQKLVGQEWEMIIPEKAKAKGYRGNYIKIRAMLLNRREK